MYLRSPSPLRSDIEGYTKLCTNIQSSCNGVSVKIKNIQIIHDAPEKTVSTDWATHAPSDSRYRDGPNREVERSAEENICAEQHPEEANQSAEDL